MATNYETEQLPGGDERGLFSASSPVAPEAERPCDELDRQDMARLVAGNDASLNDLMDRHGQKLFHYLCRIVLDETDAAELAEETFVKVYQNRARFDGDRKFSTWLYAIATNLARDRRRWWARRPEVSLEAESPLTGQGLNETLAEQGADPSEELVVAERAEMVRKAVAGLREEWRVPLVLAEYEGRSHIEIGAILSCSAKAVEMRIRRAREELRERLTDILVHYS
jgi:RNA polymerase sigma-70 factor (ECF subfamily)